MYHAKASDTALLGPAIKQAMHRTRHLVIVSNYPDYLLYGSDVSCQEALIEAVTDHPLCTLHQEIEYLPPSVLAEMRTQARSDPLARTFEDLGRINPDTDKPI